jgi:hypothetical protein
LARFDISLDAGDRVPPYQESDASRSEFIRRAARATFGEQAKADKLRALQASAGSWRGRRASGADYVDARRGGDANERLTRLGVT